MVLSLALASVRDVCPAVLSPEKGGLVVLGTLEVKLVLVVGPGDGACTNSSVLLDNNWYSTKY